MPRAQAHCANHPLVKKGDHAKLRPSALRKRGPLHDASAREHTVPTIRSWKKAIMPEAEALPSVACTQ